AVEALVGSRFDDRAPPRHSPTFMGRISGDSQSRTVVATAEPLAQNAGQTSVPPGCAEPSLSQPVPRLVRDVRGSRLAARLHHSTAQRTVVEMISTARETFRRLEAAGVRYAILRNYQQL